MISRYMIGASVALIGYGPLCKMILLYTSGANALMISQVERLIHGITSGFIDVSRNALSAVPNVNLVKNIGFGNSAATHTVIPMTSSLCLAARCRFRSGTRLELNDARRRTNSKSDISILQTF